MKSAIAECALLLMVVAVWAEPAFARSYLNCLTKEVVIVNAASGTTTEEKVGFWIDEAAKIFTLADGTPLVVRRGRRPHSSLDGTTPDQAYFTPLPLRLAA